MNTAFVKHYLFPVTVFITGACVLIVEIVAVRLLSPYFGNTIFTVSSVISVILAALSIGYYAGGKLADKKPSLRWFFGIILISSLAILLFYFLGFFILPISSLLLSVATGPLITSLLLFFIPALLLGTLSPYAIKLQSMQVAEQGIGTISGKIFFWSTLGSIIGSLLPGFILMPYFGISRIFIGVSLVLFVLGLIPLLFFGIKKRNSVSAIGIFIIVCFLTTTITGQIEESFVYSTDGVYEKLIVFDEQYEERPTRFFQQDRSNSAAMFLDSDDPNDLVFNYAKYYALYEIFDIDLQNVLVIGGGAYSLPKALLADSPEVIVDVVEIEPSLFNLAQEYFNLEDSERIHNYIEDGRRFLAHTEKQYNMIFSDVYRSLYSIPTHFTTKEFFTLVKEKLSNNGIFIANVIGDLSTEKSSFIMSEIKTLQSVFPNSFFFVTELIEQGRAQNLVFVGYNGDIDIDFTDNAIAEHPNPIIQSLNEHSIPVEDFDLTSHIVLTDDFAPVDYMMAKMLRRIFKNRSSVDIL